VAFGELGSDNHILPLVRYRYICRISDETLTDSTNLLQVSSLYPLCCIKFTV